MTKQKQYIYSLCACLCMIFNLHSQTILNSDSLIIRSLAVYQNNPEQGYKYAQQAQQKALAENSEVNVARAYEMWGVSLDYLGYLDSALLYFDKSIPILKNLHENFFLAKVYVSKANSLFLLNRYKEALAYYRDATEFFKNAKKIKEEMSATMGVANVYSSMKSYELSLKYYNQCLNYYEEVGDSVYLSYVLTNVSEVYSILNQFDNELKYQRKSLAIKERLNDDYSLVYSYSNMAGLMQRSNKKDSALYFANKAIETSIKINNQEFLTTSYQALGEVYYHYKQYTEAAFYYQKALEIAQKLKNQKSEGSLLKALAETQIQLGDYKNASQYLLQFIDVNDSINGLEMQKAFSELQTQYETDKKEKEISLLTEKGKKRQLVIYSVVVVAILFLLLSFVLYNRFRLKRKTAVELELRNNEIQHQKHLVDEKQKEILDSINYAKRIQFALLAHEEFLKKYLPEHFVLFKPKDIVSGDFYWATKKDDFFYLAVCDSTGHGVPGAFMSLLNISFLNEAINEKNILTPHEVLNHVRKRISESIDGGKDGMDAILLKIPVGFAKMNTISVEYAAANNSPVLVQSNKLQVLPKDKMPVGAGEKTDSFSLHVIQLQKGDSLYIYTDGYADQFGGPNGKKFKYKQLDELVLSNVSLPLNSQVQILQQKFDEWKGNLEQVDDVCVIGLRF